jgi:hypothetical protein
MGSCRLRRKEHMVNVAVDGVVVVAVVGRRDFAKENEVAASWSRTITRERAATIEQPTGIVVHHAPLPSFVASSRLLQAAVTCNNRKSSCRLQRGHLTRCRTSTCRKLQKEDSLAWWYPTLVVRREDVLTGISAGRGDISVHLHSTCSPDASRTLHKCNAGNMSVPPRAAKGLNQGSARNAVSEVRT